VSWSIVQHVATAAGQPMFWLFAFVAVLFLFGSKKVSDRAKWLLLYMRPFSRKLLQGLPVAEEDTQSDAEGAPTNAGTGAAGARQETASKLAPVPMSSSYATPRWLRRLFRFH
jgi:Sec-independent protein translocase protein TatA